MVVHGRRARGEQIPSAAKPPATAAPKRARARALGRRRRGWRAATDVTICAARIDPAPSGRAALRSALFYRQPPLCSQAFVRRQSLDGPGRPRTCSREFEFSCFSKRAYTISSSRPLHPPARRCVEMSTLQRERVVVIALASLGRATTLGARAASASPAIPAEASPRWAGKRPGADSSLSSTSMGYSDVVRVCVSIRLFSLGLIARARCQPACSQGPRAECGGGVGRASSTLESWRRRPAPL